MTPEKLRQNHPELFWLQEGSTERLTSYLRGLRVLDDRERVLSTRPAGVGNMNLTLRVEISHRTLIVKQSRPWVERYPQIEAPWDRVLGEARFYQLTAAYPEIASRMPRLIHVDPAARLLVLSDLGESNDYTNLYGGEALDVREAKGLAHWLSDLHALPFELDVRSSLSNREMRRLNHEHLFRFPLDRANGLDLEAFTPGLRSLRDELAADRAYAAKVAELGEAYLGLSHAEPTGLLHGDFFPGSWLRTPDGPAVIDPEFAFFGPTEFDVGVLLAHLYLADQSEATHAAFVEGYTAAAAFDWSRALAFCGVEIMRRLIGVAQLPLTADLNRKQSLLRLSRSLVVDENSLAGPCAAKAFSRRASAPGSERNAEAGG